MAPNDSACRLAAVSAALMTSCWLGPLGAVRLLDLPSCDNKPQQVEQQVQDQRQTVDMMNHYLQIERSSNQAPQVDAAGPGSVNAK